MEKHAFQSMPTSPQHATDTYGSTAGQHEPVSPLLDDEHSDLRTDNADRQRPRESFHLEEEPSSNSTSASRLPKPNSTVSGNHAVGGGRFPFLEELWWKLELVSITVSVLGLAALIGLLAYFNGRDQRAWHTGTAITLNAVVAAIATVTKSSLVFVISSCLGQAMWNWYAMPRKGSRRSSRHGRALKDMQDLDEASRGTYGSVLLLMRLRNM